LVTVRSTTKPAPQSLVTSYVTAQAICAGGGVAVGFAVGVGFGVGVGCGVAVGCGVGVGLGVGDAVGIGVGGVTIGAMIV
jgi:hypothetical protein